MLGELGCFQVKSDVRSLQAHTELRRRIFSRKRLVEHSPCCEPMYNHGRFSVSYLLCSLLYSSEELLNTFRKPRGVLVGGEVEMCLCVGRSINNYSILGKSYRRGKS